MGVACHRVPDQVAPGKGPVTRRKAVESKVMRVSRRVVDLGVEVAVAAAEGREVVAVLGSAYETVVVGLLRWVGVVLLLLLVLRRPWWTHESLSVFRRAVLPCCELLRGRICR